VGNNGWDRNGQTETLMPKLLADLAGSGVPIERVVAAMNQIGYSEDALHQLVRLESKRTTGKFGK
jgi:hypothetical protein